MRRWAHEWQAHSLPPKEIVQTPQSKCHNQSLSSCPETIPSSLVLLLGQWPFCPLGHKLYFLIYHFPLLQAHPCRAFLSGLILPFPPLWFSLTHTAPHPALPAELLVILLPGSFILTFICPCICSFSKYWLTWGHSNAKTVTTLVPMRFMISHRETNNKQANAMYRTCHSNKCHSQRQSRERKPGQRFSTCDKEGPSRGCWLQTCPLLPAVHSTTFPCSEPFCHPFKPPQKVKRN